MGPLKKTLELPACDCPVPSVPPNVTPRRDRSTPYVHIPARQLLSAYFILEMGPVGTRNGTFMLYFILIDFN